MAVNDSTFRKKLSRVLFYLLMVVTCVLIAFPIYWLLNSSFQRESALFSYPPAFFPKLFSVEGFHKLFVDGRIWRWILNTAIVTISTVGLTVIFATLAGYSFSRFRYKGRKTLSLALLSTQMLSGPMVITPLFIVFSKLGLIDSSLSLIIADTGLCIAVNTMLMKGFFDTIPVGIEEAAYIDGCNRMEALFRVTLPLTMTGMVTTLVMTFFVTWNEYLYGLIFISNQDKWIGSVGLASFIGSYVVSQDQILAGASLFSVTPVLFFMFFQKYIVVGVTSGAIKG
ncbi:MAG TPA: carbohydrate ABC transporter permease [Bacillota bacterium]